MYVNNRPFVLRELDAPFHNLSDLSGIDASRVDAIESRLKGDILAEAREHDGNVLVHDEIVHGEVRACWESCDRGTVRTTREVFEQLGGGEGYNVQLVRVPITAESVVDARQVDGIVAALVAEAAHSAGSVQQTVAPTGRSTSPPPYGDVLHIHIFNCQLGRGRSTIGLIIAYLLQCHMLGYTPQPVPPPLDPANHDGLNAYRRGEWDVILKLSRLLKNGRSAKALADIAIDACGRVHHIRAAIVAAFLRSEHARGQTQHRQLVQNTAAALKRYFYIVCFASYLQELPTALTPAFLATHSFHAFLASHRELTVLANSLIQGDTIDEVLSIPSASAPDAAKASAAADDETECPPVDRAVFARSGAVLGQRCIIKSEHWATKAEVSSYHGVFDLPLGATAQPNVAGIQKILRALTDHRGGSATQWMDSDDEHSGGHAFASFTPRHSAAPSPSTVRVVWINLREEPVIFLCSEPYLLRDYYHPFRILAEFTTGMTPLRSEQMEERLKADVLTELAASSSHQLLIHDETVYQQIRARFLPIPEPAQVQTTAEVMGGINADGGRVEYHRIPMHVEEVVGIASFDRLFTVLTGAGLGEEGEGGPSVVFHDQKGGRRVAMGLVIACLIMVYRGCVDLRVVDTDHEIADLDASPATVTPPSRNSPTHAASTTATTTATSVPLTHDAPPIDLSRGTASDSAPLKRVRSVIAVDAMSKAAELSSTGRGEYKGILSLIRILKRGRAVKDEVDLAIDVAGASYNVRDAIAEALAHHERERTGGVMKGDLLEAVKHAESYAMLIVFNAYLRARREKEDELRAEQDADRQQQTARDDEAERQSDVIASEKAAELQAQHDAQSQLEKNEKINAANITDYNLFNPYAHAGLKDSDPTAAPGTSDTCTPSRPAIDPAKDDSLTEALTKPVHPSPTGASSPAQTASSPFTFPSFSSWLHGRPELRLALEFIHHEPEEALKLNATLINEEFAAVFERRRGNVLVRGSLIKSDHFAGVMNKNVVQLVDGAVNFRPIDGFPVAGTGIPRAEGIANILQFFSEGRPHVDEEGRVVAAPPFRAASLLWLNLREEPILYVNHRPFVLRDGDNPYANLENTGITPRRVEAMEKQLKIDAWREVQEGGEGALLLHDEDENGNLICYMEQVEWDGLRTPKEEFYAVFQEREAQWRAASPSYAFTARYYRTPITDEQAPSPAALDAMIRYLEQGRDEERRVVMINCQMGRGRTTTGLIITCLWCLHRGVVSAANWAATRKRLAPPTSAPLADAPAGLSPALASSLRAGWYRLITSLVRVLHHGQALKAEVDAVVDCCGAMQNLRSVILDIQLSAMTCLPKKRSFFVRRGSNYLIRYFFLICINAYLAEQGERPEGYAAKPFVTWLNERPEILSLLKKVEFPQTDKST